MSCGPLAVAVLLTVTAAAGPWQGAKDEGCGRDLAGLEASVSASPDDLLLGAGYRQAAIRCAQPDRPVALFQALVKKHRASLAATLNLGFAYIDKIPPASDLRQALLGRSAIDQFSRSLAIRPTWLGYYTRGVVRLFYPNVFGLREAALDDLRHALAIQQEAPPRPYHARTYVALGDTYYWRFHDLDQARRAWSEGAARFPDDAALRARLDGPVSAMREIVRKSLNADVRIDTSLKDVAADVGLR
jgi:tetratricopeptide (TPR) repeat protein